MRALSEIDRRVANIVRFGTIASLDETNALVTVSIDDETETFTLPWVTPRAGGDVSWWAPEVGEQVVILSPSGELANGVVLPSIFQDAHPQNANSKDVHRTTYGDGTVVEYDRAAHALKIDTSASNGNVTINTGSGNVAVNCQAANVKASSSVKLDSPAVHCTGTLTVDGLLTYKAGMSGSGGTGSTATIVGNINVTGGEITVDGIGVKSHHHIEHDGPNTSSAQP